MDLQDLSAIPTHTYVYIGGAAILYYDYLLTFPAEVLYIWPQPLSWNTFLFYSNRYVAIFSKTMSSIVFFSNISDSEKVRCSSFILLHEALLFLNQAAVAATLTTRTAALYNNSRTVILGILAFGFVLVGVSTWSLIGSNDNYLNGWIGCQYAMSDKSAAHHAVPWEASALFDTMIFVLTFMRTLKLRKIHNMANGLAREGLLDILLRDGALYFAVMALANLANILTYYFSRPTDRGMFSTPSSCIAAALCSRLVLNLYEAATPNNTDSDPHLKPMTTVMLTTRIELGTYINDDHIGTH